MSGPDNTANSGGPAFYAQPRLLRTRRGRDWWTLLHPPYTLCHLSFVVVGGCLVDPVNSLYLWMSILAFFLAVGVGAHALDELQGRPLRTAIPALQLKAAAIVGIGGAVVLGILGTIVASAYLAIFIVIGVALALSYNLELFHGRWHTNLVFALSWGSFPVLTAYFAQHANLTFAAAVASVFAALVAGTQRQLSTPARNLRRRVSQIEGVQINLDGTTTPLSKASQLQPLESALRLLCWASVALAVSLTCARYHVL